MGAMPLVAADDLIRGFRQAGPPALQLIHRQQQILAVLINGAFGQSFNPTEMMAVLTRGSAPPSGQVQQGHLLTRADLDEGFGSRGPGCPIGQVLPPGVTFHQVFEPSSFCATFCRRKRDLMMSHEPDARH